MSKTRTPRKCVQKVEVHCSWEDTWQSPNMKKYVIEYMADDVKPNSFNLRLSKLRAFFKYCVDEGHFEDNPLEGFKTRVARAVPILPMTDEVMYDPFFV